MNDKETIDLAINDTNLLSEKQKVVLKLLCESPFPISSVNIENTMKVSRQAVDLTLKALLNRGFIIRNKERIFLYSPNQQKIFELLERYKFNISKK